MPNLSLCHNMFSRFSAKHVSFRWCDQRLQRFIWSKQIKVKIKIYSRHSSIIQVIFLGMSKNANQWEASCIRLNSRNFTMMRKMSFAIFLKNSFAFPCDFQNCFAICDLRGVNSDLDIYIYIYYYIYYYYIYIYIYIYILRQNDKLELLHLNFNHYRTWWVW